jgi:hypothetical protein
MPTTWESSSRVLGHSTVMILFAALFLIAMSAVFFGFIGYYSRVSLSNELRQNKDGASVDLLFMSVDQIAKDESALAALRKQRNELEAEANQKLDALRTSAFGSPEFAAFSDAKEKLMKLFNANRSRFSEEYWKSVGATLFKSSPEDFETELELWSAPAFRDGTTDDQKKELFDNLTELIGGITRPYRDYNAKYLQPTYQLLAAKQRASEPVIGEIRAIFARNPQLATADDRKTFIDIEAVTQETRQRLAQQRAIINSFDNLFFGGMRRILEWPTIASTLLVTLATGWLGGLVNFMGAAIRARTKRDESEPEIPGVGSLFRRCFLGITAALGIFLAAGSGLLILTAQNSGAPGAGAIELSPYFVAFLAFISGFMADDAFARLAAAGRKLFEIKEDTEDAPTEETDPAAPHRAPDGPPQRPAGAGATMTEQRRMTE